MTVFAPPVLSTAFGKVLGRRVERSGYVFQMFLPAADGSAVAEASNGGADGIAVDPQRAEQLWCAYAWPLDEKSGRRWKLIPWLLVLRSFPEVPRP